jgi:hypothetical protein
VLLYTTRSTDIGVVADVSSYRLFTGTRALRDGATGSSVLSIERGSLWVGFVL